MEFGKELEEDFGSVTNEVLMQADPELGDSFFYLKVRFAWSRQGHALSTGLDNTTLGQISIQENRMSIEVNYFPRTR